MNKIIEVNCETGETIERDETPEEIAARKEHARQETEAVQIRESALAKLQALGLTEAEVKSLLG
jgi:hypothetical protein